MSEKLQPDPLFRRFLLLPNHKFALIKSAIKFFFIAFVSRRQRESIGFCVCAKKRNSSRLDIIIIKLKKQKAKIERKNREEIFKLNGITHRATCNIPVSVCRIQPSKYF